MRWRMRTYTDEIASSGPRFSPFWRHFLQMFAMMMAGMIEARRSS